MEIMAKVSQKNSNRKKWLAIFFTKISHDHAGGQGRRGDRRVESGGSGVFQKHGREVSLFAPFTQTGSPIHPSRHRRRQTGIAGGIRKGGDEAEGGTSWSGVKDSTGNICQVSIL
jgi:hypothetical protein